MTAAAYSVFIEMCAGANEVNQFAILRLIIGLLLLPPDSRSEFSPAVRRTADIFIPYKTYDAKMVGGRRLFPDF